jgi:hypothetical protein
MRDKDIDWLVAADVGRWYMMAHYGLEPIDWDDALAISDNDNWPL